ncbi:hypothetical protein AZI86_17030 [Bdellovibrio bacteriovorus]|uniref:Cytochrome c domain-containing protein n=1 Tax=Bdellovibrio bacteriovorus TaxID=959 RepID=A0A150WE82_BDEBC|nr:hypothetical protein [Bdellovibrio bacteriovorus]KYG61417.1 hypothetical protein AZI86_17030 [Bdellovibrio bacteriovorus]
MRIIFCVFVIVTAGCEFGKTTFGGTLASNTSAVTSDDIAKNLIKSEVTLFHFDSTSAVMTGNAVDVLKNRKTEFVQGIEGPQDLSSDGGVTATLVGDVLHVEPTVSQGQFLSPVDKTITGTSASIFIVAKNSSRGNIVSFNSFDRYSQGFNISVNASEISAIFYSSPDDKISNQIAIPSSEWSIIGANYGDEGEIELSVNGILSSAATTEGVPGTSFSVPRVLSLGPDNIGDSLEFKELYVFGRPLTKLEHGSLITYLAKKNGVSVTLDPSLNVPIGDGGGSGGSTADPNFAPAQSVIESKCLNCHSSWAGARASYYVGLGLVSKNNAANSKLYYRLLGSAGSNGPKNMPQGGSLTPAEAELVRVWIDNMP